MPCDECNGSGIEPFTWGDGQADCADCPWCEMGEPKKKTTLTAGKHFRIA
jgi:hypothetical protein